MAIVQATALSGFIRTEFVNTYRRRIVEANARLRNVMQFGIPSSRSEEKYAYFNSPMHPRLWKRGEDSPVKPFNDVTYTVVNKDWAGGVQWHANDRADDQTASLLQQARAIASGFALLPERIFFQILTSTTDPLLLDAIPTAPDGAAFFATTAGGAARFGVTGGNLLTGSGVTSAQDIRSDVFNGVERFHQFQDTEGQPLWPEATLDAGYTILYNVANDQVVKEALIQSRTLQVHTPTAIATGETVGAAVTNIVMDSGMSLTLWPTQRLTDNDMFLFANGSDIKAVFEQTRQPLLEHTQLPENSDESRRRKIEGIHWNNRNGYGLALPYQAIKINN